MDMNKLDNYIISNSRLSRGCSVKAAFNIVAVDHLFLSLFFLLNT